ncbi:MAG: primase [Actinomycetota bacterium]|nr:primase [Actinomycetota bacterium]
MGIVGEDIERVREATDFVALASDHIALKKVGSRWSGLCPFHAEKTPSFTVNAEEKLFYCFGCQAKGDVITFVREIEHVDFVEAVERLAARAGIQLRYDDAAVSQDRQRRSRLVDAIEKAVDFYHQRLLTSPDAGPARQYLRSRGYDGEVVRAFKIGWAPDDWDVLCRFLKLPDDVISDAGLGFVNKIRRQTDAFRGRVMFPIFDASGKPVAFGGRILTGEGPKYKNSQENLVYSKRRTLYGLNWAKTDVVEAGEVIVCEGYTDVIGLFQVGLPRAVATCGTALADEHFNLLKNFARRVVLAYDADAAGQAAAERFYAWEQKFEIDIAVALLPTGSDPGDMARTDPDGLRKAVEQAQPFLAFRLDRALGGADLGTAEGRARAAQAAMVQISEHPNELVRDQYLMEVAGKCRVDPDRLRSLIGSTPPRRTNGTATRPRPRADRGPEVEALKLAVHRPEEVAERLDEVLFHDDLHLAAYRALAEAEKLHDAIAAADPGAAELLQRLAVEEPDTEADDVVALLVREAVRRAVADLIADQRTSPERAVELAPIIDWARREAGELDQPATRLNAANRLVAWLAERAEEVS